MVEHAAVNRRVVGSSPTRGAKKKEVPVKSASFFCCTIEPIPQQNSLYVSMSQNSDVSCLLYILRSETVGRYYIGISNNPERRLEFHNTREKGFTSRYRPWKLMYTQRFPSRQEAQQAERRIKQWKSRTMIEKVISGEIVV